MEGGFLDGQLYPMGPRVPGLEKRGLAVEMPTPISGIKFPRAVLAARAEETDCPDPRLCQKPVGSSSMTLPIVLGVW